MLGLSYLLCTCLLNTADVAYVARNLNSDSKLGRDIAQVYICDKDGSNTRQITSSKAACVQVRWEGRDAIAWTTRSNGGKFSLWYAKAPFNNPRKLAEGETISAIDPRNFGSSYREPIFNIRPTLSENFFSPVGYVIDVDGDLQGRRIEYLPVFMWKHQRVRDNRETQDDSVRWITAGGYGPSVGVVSSIGKARSGLILERDGKQYSCPNFEGIPISAWNKKGATSSWIYSISWLKGDPVESLHQMNWLTGEFELAAFGRELDADVENEIAASSLDTDGSIRHKPVSGTSTSHDLRARKSYRFTSAGMRVRSLSLRPR
ncbi:MAG: hypothetical protein KF784_10370 [Fimbriimonadaceae bacterium]|nr:hypothetical protein [Fimbriimonadaceae bacterium]